MIREVPVRPESCGLPKLPDLDIEASECQGTPGAVCLTAAGFAELQVWLQAVAQYELAIESCPYVRPGGDLKSALAADPYLKP